MQDIKREESASSSLSRLSDHPDHRACDDVINDTEIRRPAAVHTPLVEPSPAHLYPSRLPLEERVPTISLSELEAGHTKDMHSSQTCYQTDDEKDDRCDGTKVWPPWKREDGWGGWRSEWIKKESLVVPLVVQAFSAGVLDATTYADFMTFASNRE